MPKENAGQQAVDGTLRPSALGRLPVPHPRTLCLLGASLDVGNRGVKALGVSLAFLVARVRPDRAVVFLYGNATGGTRCLSDPEGAVDVTVRNCRMSPRSAPSEHIGVILGLAALYRLGLRRPAERNPWLRSLLDAELVGDIRGGDSFSDIYGLRRFLLGCLPLLTAVVLGRPYVLLPQTYGPFRSKTSRAIARLFIRRAKAVYTRDENCIESVRELTSRTPEFCPDVAFTLRPLLPVGDVPIEPSGLNFRDGDPVVGLNVSGLLYMGGYSQDNMFALKSDYRALTDALIERILRSTRAKILLVPHEFGNEHGSEGEELACRTILASFQDRDPGRVFIVNRDLSEREVKWIIGQTDFFIGARMHACIAAISQCVPAVGLAYSDKFLGVFQSAGVGDAIVDLRRCQSATVIEQVLAKLVGRAAVAARLRNQIPGVRKQVEAVFRDVLSQSA